MSIKKRLEEKLGGLTSEPVDSTAAAGRTPRTAPGQMMAFRAMAQETADREAELKRKYSAFDDALPVKKIDPERIVASAWKDRHEDSYSRPEFLAFIEEIRSTGGNVQPIKVRPVIGQAGAQFEIVFGHRRHMACKLCGLPVLAMIAELDDQHLFADMERENRNRADLSAWERGRHYALALEKGLFASQRQLAAAIGVDNSLIGKAMTVAALPAEVVAAFATPLDIQYRWGVALNAAMQKTPDEVLDRARHARSSGNGANAKAVYRYLLGQSAAGSTRAASSKTGAIAFTRDGKDELIRLAATKLSPAQREKLELFVRDLLAR
jgi:ParB family transcriptional regulator, chromosome partitioning protein